MKVRRFIGVVFVVFAEPKTSLALISAVLSGFADPQTPFERASTKQLHLSHKKVVFITTCGSRSEGLAPRCWGARKWTHNVLTRRNEDCRP